MTDIRVKLKPTQSIKVDTSNVYVFDPTLVSEYVSEAEDWAKKTDGTVDGSEYSAKAYAVGGTGTTTNNAKYYAGQAATSATNAATSETNAGLSATSAGNSATSASGSASTATTQAGIATTQAGIATTQAGYASGYASSASNSASNASTSASNSATWAEGTDEAVAVLGGQKSSKGWALYAKDLVDSIGTVLHYKGSVATYSDLPSSGQEVGDVYNVLSDGSNYAWDGTDWDDLSGIVDLSAYRTSADQDIIDLTKANVDLSNLSATGEAKFDAKQDVISDLSTIRSGAEKGETALQPNDNISELTNDAGYITSSDLPTVNNATLTIQKNGTSVATFTANSATNATANIIVPTDTGDLTNNAGYITGITSSDVTTALGYTPYSSSNPNDYQTENQVANSIATETTNRENADISLQSQIDAIVASSDVFDIVGTYAELQAYDISTVPVNDIIKVLVDSTHSNAATYYRCVETGGVKSWSYIGSEGAYYTKSEADAAFVPQTRTVNSKALSSDITLTASDVGADSAGSASTAETNAKNYADSLASNYATAAQGALADTAVQPADLATVATSGDYDDLINKPTIPTVNDATLTIQKNGVDVQTFTANQATNATANITVPTDTADLTNGAGFITSSDLPTNYVTTNTAQDISGRKTFLGEKAIYFKQSASSNKLGFTLYNTSSTEIGAFEYRPNTIGSSSFISINCPSTGGDYVGFRYWGTAVNIVAPKVATAGTYYIPVKVTDGNTTVTATSVGTVDISSLLPTVNNPTITITQGGVTKGSFTLNQASGDTIALDAGGGTSTDVQINGTSITSSNVANIITESAYNASTNKIATMSDIPNLSGYQTTANLVTSVSSLSTDSQYPSAKLFYDTCGDIETLINAL